MANVIKDLEMGRLFCWIIWVGPKSSHKHPYERQAVKDFTQTEEEEAL